MQNDQIDPIGLRHARELCGKHHDLAGPDGFGVSVIQRRLGLSFNQAADVIAQGIAAGLLERHFIHAHRAVIVTGKRRPA